MDAGAARARWGGWAAALLSTVLWGLSFVALRVALEGLEPFGLVWTRNALGAAALFVLLRARGGPLLPRPADRSRCVVMGLVLGAHLLLQTVALQWTTAVRAGWIVAFIPVVVALLAALFLRRRLAALGWAGIALSTVGVLVLTSTRPSELARAGWGDLLMVLTCFTWAAYTLLSVRPVASSGSLRVTASSMLVAALPNLVAAGFGGTWRLPPTARTVVALLFLALGASATALWAFNRAVVALGPERSAAFQYLQPFVTLAGSFLLLAEPVTSGALLGGPIVLLGVWMTQRSRTVRRPAAAQGRMRV